MKDMVLLKDIVIPKGTVLSQAPTSVTRYQDVFIEAIIGLSPNTSGTFVYAIDDDKDVMDEYFAELK